MGAYMNFLFNPNGRISRKDIWLKFFLVSIIASFVSGAIDAAVGVELFSAIVSLFFLWPGFAVPIKRFHDRGMTGWWVLFVVLGGTFSFIIMFLPLWEPIMANLNDLEALDEERLTEALTQGSGMATLMIGFFMFLGVAIFAFVVNYCLPGEQGTNRYGPDPLNPQGSQIDVFN